MSEEKEIKQEELNESDKKTKVMRGILGIIILITVVGLGAYAIYKASFFQSTDDAYVETTTVSVAPKVSGQIIKTYVTDNQFVKEGDLVAEIDPADYEVRVDLADATYKKVLLNQKNAQANLVAANSAIELARKDLERYKNLYESGAVSKQTLDMAQAKYDSAQANFTSANEAILSQEQEQKVADTDLKSAKAALDQAKLNLSYTKIYAPQSGTVSSRRVEKGMYVQVGTPLFVIVPENVWVVANFKENQLEKMKVGQEVDIKIDAYPKKTFKGKIDSIQRASGAKSSLFPPENAVGSFVKIVQRIPVKIVFTEEIDPNEYNIVPGMSVVPKVRVK